MVVAVADVQVPDLTTPTAGMTATAMGMHPGELMEIKRKTLEWVNVIRGELGAEALVELPRGYPRHAAKCPLAKALSTAQGCARVTGWVAIENGYRCNVPRAARLFVALFDVGEFPELALDGPACLV